MTPFGSRRVRTVITVLIGAGALVIGGCRSEKNAGVQGYVEGEFVYMAAPAGGIIKSLAVDQGDWITSGTFLFAMDSEKENAAVAEAAMRLAQGNALLEDAREGQRPSEIEEIEARLKQAQAALELSRKTLERQTELHRERVASTEELDQAKSAAERDQQSVSEIQAQLATARQGQRTNQVIAAEANVKALQAAQLQAQWNLDQTSQTAPADAIVFDTFFCSGEFVAAGRPVVSLLPPEKVRVRAFLPEMAVGSLQLGTSATITMDGVDTPVDGVVTFISPKAEFTPPVIYSREMRQKLSFMVEISFPPDVAARLHPGQPVDVYFAGLPE